jgi:hypothetical protein
MVHNPHGRVLLASLLHPAFRTARSLS